MALSNLEMAERRVHASNAQEICMTMNVLRISTLYVTTKKRLNLRFPAIVYGKCIARPVTTCHATAERVRKLYEGNRKKSQTISGTKSKL